MFLLHISIALGNYFNININIENIYPSDWFMFFSSYLGGSVALIGVILTIRHSTSVHNHQIAMGRLQEERNIIVQAISQLDTMEPISIFKLFASMNNEYINISTSELALINDRIYIMQHKIINSRISMFVSSNATNINPNCNICKTPCMLKTVIPEILENFENLTDTLNHTLNLLDDYIRKSVENTNISKEIKRLENEKMKNINSSFINYDDKINSLQNKYFILAHDADELLKMCKKCSKMNANEITKLIGLTRIYIIEKENNSHKYCFKN